MFYRKGTFPKTLLWVFCRKETAIEARSAYSARYPTTEAAVLPQLSVRWEHRQNTQHAHQLNQGRYGPTAPKMIRSGRSCAGIL